MANINALAKELSEDPLGRGYAAMTDQEAADDINTLYRQQSVPIQVSEMRRYMFVNGLWMTLKKSTTDLAEEVRDAVNMFETFEVGDSDVQSRLTGMMDALVTQGFMTDADKQNILAMGVTTQSRAVELGLLGASPKIGPAHVEHARSL